MLVLRASLCVFALFLSPPHFGARESGPRSGLKGPPGPSLKSALKFRPGTALAATEFKGNERFAECQLW